MRRTTSKNRSAGEARENSGKRGGEDGELGGGEHSSDVCSGDKEKKDYFKSTIELGIVLYAPQALRQPARRYESNKKSRHSRRLLRAAFGRNGRERHLSGSWWYNRQMSPNCQI